MQIFSQNACLLGIIYGAFVILFNWVIVLYAVWRKMKIEEVRFLLGEKALLRTEVKGVKFTLAWIPFGTFVKILGMGSLTEEEKLQIPKEDLPHAFFNQPFWARLLFKMLTPLIYLSMVLVTFAFGLDFTTFKKFFGELTSFYFSFGGFDQFILVASDFTKTHSEILLVLLFVNLIAIFQTLLNETMKLSILDSEKTNAALRSVANIIVLISSVWMLYKLLGFALVHYGYLQLFFLYINLLAAILLVNVVLFFVMLPLFRMILPAPRAVEGN